MPKRDVIKNMYELVPKKLQVNWTNDKNYNQHMIDPCSMIIAVGCTGTGKSNGILNLISRKKNTFCEIILFTNTTTDEPLYNLLKEKIPDVQLISKIDEMPKLKDFEDDEKVERLLIFDDMAGMNKNQEELLNEWFKAARKLGFTVIYLGQKWSGKTKEGGIPMFVRTQAQYIMMYRVDEDDAKRILSKYKFGCDKDKLLELYNKEMQIKFNFLLFDVKNRKIRQGFTNVLN